MKVGQTVALIEDRRCSLLVEVTHVANPYRFDFHVVNGRWDGEYAYGNVITDWAPPYPMAIYRGYLPTGHYNDVMGFVNDQLKLPVAVRYVLDRFYKVKSSMRAVTHFKKRLVRACRMFMAGWRGRASIYGEDSVPF